MATVKSGTLTPNVIKEVTVDVDRFGDGNQVGVLNRDEAGVVWVRLDGVDPVIEGDDSYPVMNYRLFSARDGYPTITLKMISDTAIDYTVEGKG